MCEIVKLWQWMAAFKMNVIGFFSLGMVVYRHDCEIVRFKILSLINSHRDQRQTHFKSHSDSKERYSYISYDDTINFPIEFWRSEVVKIVTGYIIDCRCSHKIVMDMNFTFYAVLQYENQRPFRKLFKDKEKIHNMNYETWNMSNQKLFWMPISDFLLMW